MNPPNITKFKIKLIPHNNTFFKIIQNKTVHFNNFFTEILDIQKSPLYNSTIHRISLKVNVRQALFKNTMFFVIDRYSSIDRQ